MRLVLRAVVAGALSVVPWAVVDAVRRLYVHATPGSARARALFYVVNVMRHRCIEPSIAALRIEPLGILFSNDNSVLTKRLFFLGEYEAGEWQWWDHWCRRSSRVVEFGANTGFYTIVGGRIPTLTEYVAVEPHPHTAEVLRRNLALNGVERVRVVEAAVVGEPHRQRMALHVPDRDLDETPTGAFLATDGGEADGSRTSILVDVVEARTLAAGVQLIKMDIEGQELAVLRSIEDILALCKPTIFLELRSRSTELRGYLPSLCERFGYRVFAIDGARLREVDVADVAHLNFKRRFGTRDIILTTEVDAALYVLAPRVQDISDENVATGLGRQRRISGTAGADVS